jgi:hypothetical protein
MNQFLDGHVAWLGDRGPLQGTGSGTSDLWVRERFGIFTRPDS